MKELPRNPDEGLAGWFPDCWGRLLFDRLQRSEGTFPSDISPLDRFAFVGLQSMGAVL